MTPQELKRYEMEIANRKDKFCKKCNRKFVKTTLNICPSCRLKLVVDGENIPKCPTCGSFNISTVSQTKRSLHAWAFGIANPTARAQFECKNCGYKW